MANATCLLAAVPTLQSRITTEQIASTVTVAGEAARLVPTSVHNRQHYLLQEKPVTLP